MKNLKLVRYSNWYAPKRDDLFHQVDMFFSFVFRRPPKSPHCSSSAASDVYKRLSFDPELAKNISVVPFNGTQGEIEALSLIHISERTRLLSSSYVGFCLKKKEIISRLNQISLFA